jgi:hypothetical protein
MKACMMAGKYERMHAFALQNTTVAITIQAETVGRIKFLCQMLVRGAPNVPHALGGQSQSQPQHRGCQCQDVCSVDLYHQILII